MFSKYDMVYSFTVFVSERDRCLPNMTHFNCKLFWFPGGMYVFQISSGSLIKYFDCRKRCLLSRYDAVYL